MSCNTTSEEKKSFSWLSFFYKERENSDNIKKIETEPIQTDFIQTDFIVQIAEEKQEESKTISLKYLIKFIYRTLFKFKNIVDGFGAFVAQNRRDLAIIRQLCNCCIAGALLILMCFIFGAWFFQSFEHGSEISYKNDVKRIENDFLNDLYNGNNLSESEWKIMASKKLMVFQEQLRIAQEAGSQSYSDQKNWSFLNAFTYCVTLITTYGYGYITPNTNMGKIMAIVYTIGIPMFITILSNFDKLFKHSIKFMWTFIKLYYTGSYRKLGHTMPVQNSEEIEEMQRQQIQQQQTVINLDANASGTPDTLVLSTFSNDKFNLSTSIVIFIFLTYIFMGVILYHTMENWDFFDSFYFAFISVSTAGFGNYVPKEPIYMIKSIMFMVFSQPFRSMYISIMQAMLSNLFKYVSRKIGITMYFEIAEDELEETSTADENHEHQQINF